MEEATMRREDRDAVIRETLLASKAWGATPLRIREIETDALRVPLPRVFRGSRYKMDTRCTIITRVVTEEGIVGEAYIGDEDEAQAAIQRVIQ